MAVVHLQQSATSGQLWQAFWLHEPRVQCVAGGEKSAGESSTLESRVRMRASSAAYVIRSAQHQCRKSP